MLSNNFGFFSILSRQKRTSHFSKMSSFFKFVALSGLIFLSANAYPEGAPPNSCISMLPEHSAEPQTSPSPFTTTPELVGI